MVHVFPKEIFENVNFENNQQTTKKHVNLASMQSYSNFGTNSLICLGQSKEQDPLLVQILKGLLALSSSNVKLAILTI